MIFYGGSGINIASFCCDRCQSEGIKGIAEGYCYKVHCHDYEDSEESDTDSVCDAHKTHCALYRIIFDWDTYIISILKCEPYGFDLVKICLPD